ncbi:ABC transporter substrate-binding protein [Endozoicomonas ascidiicola]|uniref:ABC transporter substrate-binding protein n=1 Tax=Endozoicomonas ascidiicola TaxID=1698521 RepID=UPI00082B5AA3|nr:ABC transporter substrate-binding protein [Endozoicomonas ascidiicola]
MTITPVCVLNTRHPPLDNLQVRKALAYLMDFEWSNRTLFDHAYIRSASYFPYSAYAAEGLPSEEEIAVLSPYKNALPEGAQPDQCPA